MTITTELLSFDSADVRVGIRVAYIAGRSRVRMPIAMLTRHESRLVRPRICTPDPVGIHVAKYASRVCTLRIMAGSATFNIPKRELGVQAAAGSDTRRHKSNLPVRFRLELPLIHISACLVARRAERPLIMACLTFCGLALGRQTMGELEVEIVHFRYSLTLTPVIRRQPGRPQRHQIPAGNIDLRQVGPVMAFRA